MRKPVRIIGTTIAAAAIVGATGTAASAHDGYDHHGSGGFGQQSFGGHASFDRHGFAAHGSFDHHSWGYHSDNPADDPGEDSGSAAPSYDPGSISDHSRGDHGWWGSDFAHHGAVTPFADDQDGTDEGTDTAPSTPSTAPSTPSDQASTFGQRKAAVVSALQAADARLTALQDRLTGAAAANDPTGFAPKALPYVTQARAHVESLLAQVRSATTDQQLAEILQQAPGVPAAPVPTPAA